VLEQTLLEARFAPQQQLAESSDCSESTEGDKQ